MATSVVSAIARRSIAIISDFPIEFFASHLICFFLPSVPGSKAKVAVITSGASGISKSTAGLFACHDARMIVADVQDNKGLALCTTLSLDVASFVHCDVTKESDVKRAVDAAVSHFRMLDVMFNNVGVVENLSSGFLHFKDAASEFARVMGVNVLGAFPGTKHAVRVMATAGRGSIVTTASTASVMGGLALPVYTFSKHAVVGLMRSVAAELGRFGVRVNCLSTHLLAIGISMAAMNMSCEGVEKVAEASANLKGVALMAEDMAEAVLYLGSDESKYVSRLNLVVNGRFMVAKDVGLLV